MDEERGAEEDIGAAVRKVRALLQQSMLRDRAYVGRKLQALRDKSRRARDPETALEALNGLAGRLEASIREKEERIARCPVLRYPRELPIVARRQDIVRAIRDNQVVIISGETGCGKSTQIPKMCLEAGGGINGGGGVTPPPAPPTSPGGWGSRWAGRSATRSASRTGPRTTPTSRS